MLWIGGSLGRIEQLSIASWLAAGYHVRLHTYGDVRGVPTAVEMSDANAVAPAAEIENLRHRKTRSYALASDYFRYRLQAQGQGLWSDLDIVCLKPLNLPNRVIFGLESWDFINGAVLSLDPSLAMTAELAGLFDRSFVPPWLPRKRKVQWALRRAVGQKPTPARLPWGTFGPRAITAMARKHDLFWEAQPTFVFYPLHAREAHYMYDPRFSLESRINERTLTVHLWNEALRGLKSEAPPKGSALDVLNKRFGI
ncbi:hypothetical protein [Mesorhizobium sp. CAU 1732]|uniref:hypothetical protein n=1 Tax=Mesorhizobium sp. CAU 1732 TaxID=3140358 RepID=UPI003260A7B4